VLYHLRTLEAQRLVEAQDHGTVGRRIDRTYVRTATSYAIAPKTLGGVAVDPRTVADAFSSAYLSAVAGRALNDLAALGQAAAARGKRVPTMTLETAVRFATPADQRQFAGELTTALAALAARFHRPDATHGRVWGYIVGNEVNSHWWWYNMGRVPLEEIAAEYERAVRIVHTAVRRASLNARVYLSFEHHWAIRYPPGAPDQSRRETRDRTPGAPGTKTWRRALPDRAPRGEDQ